MTLRHVLVRLILISGLSVSCAVERPTGRLRILDAIPPEELSVPWSLSLWTGWLGPIARNAEGLAFEKGRMVQSHEVSVIRFEALLGQPGTVLARVAYQNGWHGKGTVEVRLIRDGEPVSAVRETLGGNAFEGMLTCPDSGSVIIELRHEVTPGAIIPLEAVVLGESAPDVAESELDELRWYLAWLADPSVDTRRGLPASRRAMVSAHGSTKDCLLLTPHRSVSFALPETIHDQRLRFWCTSLVPAKNNGSAILIEAKESSTWRVLEKQPMADRSQWSMRTLDAPAGWGHYDSLRVSIKGTPSFAAIGEPVFVADDRTAERWNLILVFLDTVRADRLGCYGYQARPTSERLDSLFAAKGFGIFTNAFAPAPWTLSSATKFLSSRYLHRELEPNVPIDTTAPMLQEILSENGYYCTAFTGGGLLRTPGFEKGFLEYHYSNDLGKVEDSFPQAVSWLKRHNEPFFLFVHTYEAHQPYTRTIFSQAMARGRLGDPSRGRAVFPPGWNACGDLTRAEQRYINALYDGGVRAACDAVADLFIRMDDLGLWDRTVVVVLSDHGEEFGEHFNVFGDHSHSLYQELLHVPLAIYHPGMSGSRFVDEAVSLVDLVPTIARILELEWSGVGDGVDLSPLLVGRSISRPLPILASLSNSMEWDGICLVHDDLKYIETTRRTSSSRARKRDCVEYPAGQELYRLDSDPNENEELSQQEVTLRTQMAAQLRDACARVSLPVTSVIPKTTGALQPALRDQLRALGYLEDNERFRNR